MKTKEKSMSKDTTHWVDAIREGQATIDQAPTRAIKRWVKENKKRLDLGCSCFEHPSFHNDLEADVRTGEAELARRREGKPTRADLEETLQTTLHQLEMCRREVRDLNPPEPGPNSFVRFAVQYGIPGRPYSYGAMRVGDRWYLCGKNGLGGFHDGTWTELCRAYRSIDIGHEAFHNGRLQFEVGSFR